MWEDTAFSIFLPEADAPRQNGFSLDLDVAKEIVKELRGYQDRLWAMKRKVGELCTMKAPSRDPSTVAAHVAMVGDGGAKIGAFSYGQGHIDLQLAYVTELIDRITKALQAVGQNEQDQTSTLNQIHPAPQGKLK